MTDEAFKRLTDKIHYWNLKQKAINSWSSAIAKAEEALENKKAEADEILPDLLKERKAIEKQINDLVKMAFPMIPFPEWED